MPNVDYSLDPFQVEEDNLKEAMLRALKRSQTPLANMDDPSARSWSAYDRAQGNRDVTSLQGQRVDLS